MLFSISAGLLALSALASALPHLQHESAIQERGLVWAPYAIEGRNERGGNNKDVVKVIDTTIIQLTESSRNSEIQLTIIVQETLTIQKKKRNSKDNIRRNHYANKNKDVNTVIIVVTQIIDVRDGNNKKNRYMTHQLKANGKNKRNNNNNNNKDVTVQITEIIAITIGGSNDKGSKNSKTEVDAKPTRVQGAAKATGAKNAEASIQTIEANAPYTRANQTIILPEGAEAPRFETEEFDPAAILEDDQLDFFVQFSS